MEVNDTSVTYKAVDSMIILGTAMDRYGSTAGSLDHRLCIGESVYWKHLRLLSQRGSVGDRLQAWAAAPAALAIHNSGTCHLSWEALHQIKRWDYKWVWKMFKFSSSRSRLREGGYGASLLKLRYRIAGRVRLTRLHFNDKCPKCWRGPTNPTNFE